MSDFKFIAFDQHTGRPLGHGPDPELARTSARAFSESRSIRVIPVGNAGLRIWAEKMTLDRARAAIVDAISATES